MGQELPYKRERELRVDVCGWDEVDRVEVVKNNRVIHRDFPIDRPSTAASWKNPVLTRLEYGWGPWAALSMGGTCDWEIEITLQNGVLEDVQPAFLPGPLEEDRRDRVLNRTDRSVRLQSFTARKQTIDDCSQKALALKISGGPDTRLKVAINSPATLSITRSLRELAESNEIAFVGPYPAESILLHRLVFNENFQTSFSVEDEDDGRETNWYYARVIQSNGQLAWSSPIWVEKRSGNDKRA
jgi:hypothetical protein